MKNFLKKREAINAAEDVQGVYTFVLINCGKNYEAISGDAELIAIWSGIPRHTHTEKYSFYGQEKFYYVSFPKSQLKEVREAIAAQIARMGMGYKFDIKIITV